MTVNDTETKPEATEKPTRLEQLEREGDIAADYLEALLDIADLDGDIDMDVEGDRAIHGRRVQSDAGDGRHRRRIAAATGRAQRQGA